MKRISSRVGAVVLGTALLGGFVGTTSAVADMDRWTSAAHSWRSGNNQAVVQDTKADSTSVYTEYNRNHPSTTLYTLHNQSGAGTIAYSNTGGDIWDMRACTSYTGPDDCSSWWSDDN
ncbi:hypothetical protein [Streptomyces sp. NBC_01207]|uniref:hypothetical protein n=1 Tax=Streptomyces sp. NBC_01207 TaxID=2903772 RepID=UPI002E152756|nr:hypothetical protein OG457_48770 [Streptomyces sp. NBC_01207]